jgi:hypothetical protein
LLSIYFRSLPSKLPSRRPGEQGEDHYFKRIEGDHNIVRLFFQQRQPSRRRRQHPRSRSPRSSIEESTETDAIPFKVRSPNVTNLQAWVVFPVPGKSVLSRLSMHSRENEAKSKKDK